MDSKFYMEEDLNIVINKNNKTHELFHMNIT